MLLPANGNNNYSPDLNPGSLKRFDAGGGEVMVVEREGTIRARLYTEVAENAPERIVHTHPGYTLLIAGFSGGTGTL